jgi:hypothetical protein
MMYLSLRVTFMLMPLTGYSSEDLLIGFPEFQAKEQPSLEKHNPIS